MKTGALRDSRPTPPAGRILRASASCRSARAERKGRQCALTAAAAAEARVRLRGSRTTPAAKLEPTAPPGGECGYGSRLSAGPCRRCHGRLHTQPARATEGTAADHAAPHRDACPLSRRRRRRSPPSPVTPGSVTSVDPPVRPSVAGGRADVSTWRRRQPPHPYQMHTQTSLFTVHVTVE